MDTSKQPHTSPHDESEDDLIAQVARLVAKDVRPDNPGTQDRRRQVEPGFAPSEAEEGHAAPSVAPETSHSGPQEASLRDERPYGQRASDRRQPDLDDVLPAFDFGFGTADKVAETTREEPSDARSSEPEHDPIADLIADAEADHVTVQTDEGEGDDLFAVPPVGSENRTAPTWESDYDNLADDYRPGRSHAGQEDRDPLSEIEALIGEAARVSAAGPGGRRVRSSFLGEDEDSQEAARAVDLAEDSIRTATQARQREEPVRHEPEPEPAMPDLGAATFSAIPDVGAGPETDQEPAAREDAPRSRRRPPGFLVPAIAGAAIFLLIGGAYVMFFSPPTETGEPPVLTADASPLKEEPAETETASAASESVVFNEMSGTASAESETLVSRDETGGVTGDAVSSIVSSEDGVGELVNRSVRTVTVLPDGTIVSSDDGVAGGSVLPVDRPDVPTINNSASGDDPIGDAITAAIGEDVVGTDTPAADTAATAVADTADGTVEAETEGAEGDEVTDAPRPIPRPEGLVASNATVSDTLNPLASGDQPTSAVSTPSLATTATPAATTAPASAGTEPAAAWVQLASQRSEEVARAGVSDLQARYGALFNGAVPEVSRVDLAERGIYYRVRLPQPSMADANAVCDAIKGQGGDCFVLNN